MERNRKPEACVVRSSKEERGLSPRTMGNGRTLAAEPCGPSRRQIVACWVGAKRWTRWQTGLRSPGDDFLCSLSH